MEIKINKGDIIWSYLGTFTTMCSHIIMLPFLVYFLDEEVLGLWYVFVSIGAIANLFDFGFTLSFARNITYCWSGANSLQKKGSNSEISSEPDFKLMKVILLTCKIIYFILSAVVFLLLITIGSAYVLHIGKHLDGSAYIWAWIIYAIAVFLNLYYNYYDSFLRGVGAIKLANRNKVIARIVQFLMMIILLSVGMGILGASIAFLFYGTIFRFLSKKNFYAFLNIKEKLAAVKQKTSLQEIKKMFFTIWYNAWRDGIIQVSAYCCDQASVLICSMYLTLTETGVYSIALQIATAIAQLAAVLYSTYQPSLQAAFVTKNTLKMKKTMSVIIISYVGLFAVGLVGFIILGIPIFKLIKPEAIISIPILLGIALNQFILKLRNCYSSYFSCTNRIIYSKAFITSAFLCLVLSWLFMGVFHLGIWGLITAQVVSQLIFNVWYWPVKAHRELNLKINEMVSLSFSILKSATV